MMRFIKKKSILKLFQLLDEGEFIQFAFMTNRHSIERYNLIIEEEYKMGEKKMKIVKRF
jgi:hypothetical protein